MNKKIFLFPAIIISLTICSCKNNENKQAAEVKDSLAIARDSSLATVYACPMDTEVTSDQPGQCPKCGMDLEIKNQKK